MKRLAGVMIVTLAACGAVACGSTDVGITTAVKAKFAADDLVKAYQITVTTEDRVVTLEGEVDTEVAKERAVDLAGAADGVRDVTDRLVVREITTTEGESLGQEIGEGIDATADAVKKAGRTVRDAVTDRDRDSDNDGH